MKLFRRLKTDDKVFIINGNDIEEIELDHSHLKENINERRFLLNKYRLRSLTARFGRVSLVRAEYHEEMRWHNHHYMKRWYDYEKTDKVAYLSLKAAEAKLAKLDKLR